MTTTTAKTPKDKMNGAANDTVETIASVGKETLESVVFMSAQAAAESYKNAAQFSKEQLDATKSGYEKAAAYGKGNLEAYSAASAAMIAGFETYYEHLVDYSKKAVAQNMEMVQRFYTAKTPQEALDFQIEAVNTMVNRVISESTQFSKLAADTATKFVQPLKDRMEGNVDAFVKPFLG
jgi:phasin family protein